MLFSEAEKDTKGKIVLYGIFLAVNFSTIILSLLIIIQPCMPPLLGSVLLKCNISWWYPREINFVTVVLLILVIVVHSECSKTFVEAGCVATLCFITPLLCLNAYIKDLSR